MEVATLEHGEKLPASSTSKLCKRKDSERLCPLWQNLVDACSGPSPTLHSHWAGLVVFCSVSRVTDLGLRKGIKRYVIGSSFSSRAVGSPHRAKSGCQQCYCHPVKRLRCAS